MNKKYWLINVVGVDGYSFIVLCDANTPDSAIDLARKADLFNDVDDWKSATSEIADNDTVAHYKKWGCVDEL